MYRRQRPKSSQRGKKREKGKWLSKEALQIAEKRSKKQRRKGKKYLNEFRVQKNRRERKSSQRKVSQSL